MIKKKKRKVYVGKTEKEILKMIGMGLLVSASFVAPNLPIALHGILKDRSKKNTFKRSFNNIYEKNLIILSGERIHLSKKGQELLDKVEREEIILGNKSQWDGIWRIVAYDVPEEDKKERDYFRKKLRSWGFEELQKSMFVFPYECKEEVAVVAQNIGISPHVMYLVTDHLPKQNEMVKRFDLEEEYLKFKEQYLS